MSVLVFVCLAAAYHGCFCVAVQFWCGVLRGGDCFKPRIVFLIDINLVQHTRGVFTASIIVSIIGAVSLNM